MYCSECGKQLADNAKFCRFCGAAQEVAQQEQPQAAQQAQAAQQSQAAQQVRLETVCPNCGVTFEGNGMFCVKCGTKRNTVVQSAAYQTAQQTANPQQQYYAAPQQRYAPVANNASGGKFLALVPLIITVIATVIAVVSDISIFMHYYDNLLDFFASQGIYYFVAVIVPLVVPVLCTVNGMMKDRSKAFCVVVAVLAGVSLLLQIVLNITNVAFGYSYLYGLPTIVIRIAQLISGTSVVSMVTELMNFGFSLRYLLITLTQVLFVVKNIVALVSMLVLASKAKK